MSWLQGYSLPFSKKPIQSRSLISKQFSCAENQQMTAEIIKLLKIGAIRQCTPQTGQFISRIFLADKQNGQKRFILNLKQLNQFIIAPHSIIKRSFS